MAGIGKNNQTGTYNTIDETCMVELVVKKSRFIAVAFHVESIEDVRNQLGKLKKSNPNAKHIPYGYMIGSDFSTGRNNDDEEPAGTAGEPIYSAIKAANLSNVLIAVVRYFGGIELGRAKLASTYNTVATECVTTAKKYRMKLCGFYEFKVPYSEFAKLGKIVGMKGLPVLEKNFDEVMPILKVAIPLDTFSQDTEEIKGKIAGSVIIEKEGEGYYRFPW